MICTDDNTTIPRMTDYTMKCKSCGARRTVQMTPEQFVASTIECSKCGAEMVRHIVDFRPGAPGGMTSSCWPKYSLAYGVPPSMIAEAAALDRKLGVNAEYAPNGDKRFSSSREERKWRKAHTELDSLKRRR